MISKDEIGKRIKKIREEQHLTLKNVEAKAGISATHISEIERGKTSPTIGALIRIADALERDPAYFIEDEELERRLLRRVRGPQAVHARALPGDRPRCSRNRSRAARSTRSSSRSRRSRSQEVSLHAHEGDEAALVLQGKVRFKVAEKRYDLGEGDSIYFLANQDHGYANASGSEQAKMIWFASERKVD